MSAAATADLELLLLADPSPALRRRVLTELGEAGSHLIVGQPPDLSSPGDRRVERVGGDETDGAGAVLTDRAGQQPER